MKRPVVWSIWPSISTTPAIAVSRSTRAGCRTALERICSRMSGEALKSTPSAPTSGRTKIDDCVRALARSVPRRTPVQLAQLQFHCGKPPPAAEPKMVTRMGDPGKQTPWGQARAPVPNAGRSACGDVHRDFEAEAEIRGRRSGPLHGSLLSLGGAAPAGTCGNHVPEPMLRAPRPTTKPPGHESRLMIFMNRRVWPLATIEPCSTIRRRYAATRSARPAGTDALAAYEHPTRWTLP